MSVPDPTGYVHCAHECCFALIIGRAGDLCDDCEAEHPEPAIRCDACDTDEREPEPDYGAPSASERAESSYWSQRDVR